MEEQILNELQRQARKLNPSIYRSRWQIKLRQWTNKCYVAAISLFPIAVLFLSMGGRTLGAVMLLLAIPITLSGIVCLILEMAVAVSTRFTGEVKDILGHHAKLHQAATKLRARFPAYAEWKKLRSMVESWVQRSGEAFGLRIALAAFAFSFYLALLPQGDTEAASSDLVKVSLSWWKLGFMSSYWWMGIMGWLFLGSLLGACLACIQRRCAMGMRDIIRFIDDNE